MVANRARYFSFTLDLGALGSDGEPAVAKDELGYSVIGSPTFPTMAMAKETETSGRPYERAYDADVPLANRRLAWEIAAMDTRLLQIGGRPYGFLGPDSNGVVTEAAGLPRFVFRTIVPNPNGNGQWKTIEWSFQGALDPPVLTGLTGGEFTRMSLVVPDVQVKQVKTGPFTAPGATNVAVDKVLVDISLTAQKYEIFGHDRWAGMKGALALVA